MTDVQSPAAPPKKPGHRQTKSISSRIIEGARDELVQKFLSGEHCTLHPHQRVCLYCPDSCELVCPLCVTTVHQGKKFEELTEAVNRIYKDIELKLDVMMENNDTVKDLCANLRKIQTEIHFNSVTKQDQIRRGIETLRNLADERETDLIDSIQTVEADKLGRLKRQLENTWEEQQQLKRLGEDATSALGTTKPTSLLHQIKLLDKWCAKDLDEIEEEMDDTSANFLVEDPCVTSDIGKTLPTYKNGLPLMPSQLALLDFKKTDGQAVEVAVREVADEQDEADAQHDDDMVDLKAQVEAARAELAETNLRLDALAKERAEKQEGLERAKAI